MNLKLTDIDSERMVIRVEQGKRKKDRYTILSPVLLDMLRNYWWAARPVSYLFPGRRQDRPIRVSTVQRACQDARARAGPSWQAVCGYVASQFCHAPARIRNGHPHPAGAAG